MSVVFIASVYTPRELASC